MEWLNPSKRVIFRISKLSSKSIVDQSGQRSTQSQTLLQNRGTGLQRQGKLKTQRTPILYLHATLTSEEHF